MIPTNALLSPLAAIMAALLLVVLPSYSHAAPDFPTVDAATQKSRDDTRRQILEGELTTEQDLLAKVQQSLTAAQTAKQADKFSSLQEELARHQSNVAALKREIGRIGQAPVATRTKSSGPVVLRATQPQEASQEPNPYWDVYRRSQPSKQAQQSQKSVSSILTNSPTQGMSK
jgi:hypothetical protein